LAFARVPSNASSVVPTAHGGGFAIGAAGTGGGTGGGFPLGGRGGTSGAETEADAAGVGGGADGRFLPSGGTVVGGMGLVCIGGGGKLEVLAEGPVVIPIVDALAFPFGVLAGNDPGRAVVGLV
jgi:hypothetical protein